MNVDKKSIKIISLIIISSIVLAGCAEPKQVKDGTVYTTEFPQSAMEYTIFIDKEIVTVTNELTTQILLSKFALQGTYPIEDAIDSAKNSIDIIQDCIDTVDTMNPTNGYDETRVRVLKQFANCKADIEAYLELLEEGNLTESNINSVKALMQADYLALTGEFNVQYK